MIRPGDQGSAAAVTTAPAPSQNGAQPGSAAAVSQMADGGGGSTAGDAK